MYWNADDDCKGLGAKAEGTLVLITISRFAFADSPLFRACYSSGRGSRSSCVPSKRSKKSGVVAWEDKLRFGLGLSKDDLRDCLLFRCDVMLNEYVVVAICVVLRG